MLISQPTLCMHSTTPPRPYETGKLGILDRVHSIEGLSFNILSISQLCNKTTPFRFVVGDDDHAYVIRKSDGSIFIKGDFVGGLWYCSFDEIFTPEVVCCCMAGKPQEDEYISYANCRLQNPALRLHYLTGHMGFQKLRAAYDAGTLGNHGIKFKFKITPQDWEDAATFCKGCAEGKSKHIIPKKGSGLHQPTRIFEVMSMDTFEWKPVSVEGFKYATLLFDHYSKMRYIFFLKKKSDIYFELKAWFQTHLGKDCNKLKHMYIPVPDDEDLTELPRGIDIFRSDNAAEYKSEHMKDLMHDFFVRQRQTIVAHIHHQNGTIERQIGLLNETGRCLFSQLSEPKKANLYPHVLAEAIYITNRTPNADGMSPYEHAYGKVPDFTTAAPIGCIGWAVLPHVYRYSKNPLIPELRRSDKMRPRAIRVKYLGHVKGKRAHKCLILSTGRVAIFATVYWDERRFGKCGIAGGLKVRKGRFQSRERAEQLERERQEEMRKREARALPRKAALLSLPELFEVQDNIEMYRPEFNTAEPELGCSRCRFGKNGCDRCQARLQKWRKQHELYLQRHADQGEDSDSDSSDAMWGGDLISDSGSDITLSEPEEIDEELRRENPITASAFRGKRSLCCSLRGKRAPKFINFSTADDVLTDKTSPSAASDDPQLKGQLLEEDYVDALLQRDSELPDFTGYRNPINDYLRKRKRRMPLTPDHLAKVLDVNLDEMPNEVICVNVSESEVFYIPVPDKDIARVWRVKNSVETWSHFEYINTMCTGTFVPDNGKECLKNTEWRDQAMFPEFEKLEKMKWAKIIDKSDMPEGAKVISGKWVFKQKLDKLGQPDRKKGRYVARGFSQRLGIDYSAHHTYSPVASSDAIRLMLNVCAKEGHILEQADITNAYIISKLKKDIFMPLPVGYVEYMRSKNVEIKDPHTKRVKLERSLYGLRQSAFLFYQSLSDALRSLGFKECSEPCIFCRTEDDGSTSRIAVYVDDLILGFKEQSVLDKFKEDLGNVSELYEVKQLGPLEHLLGVRIDYNREKKTIKMDQQVYIERMGARFAEHLADINPVFNPMDLPTSLMFRDPAEWRFQHKEQEEGDKLCDPTLYKSVVGSLLHAVRWTRPDAMTATYFAASAMHRPTELALRAALVIVQYLVCTSHLPLTYNLSEATLDLTAYSDSDLAGWHDGRSRSGWLIKFGAPHDLERPWLSNNAPFVWNCRLEQFRTSSTPDAEQTAYWKMTNDLIIYRRLAHEMGCNVTITDGNDVKLSLTYCDNNTFIKRVANPLRARMKQHNRIRLFTAIERASEDSDDRICVVTHIPGTQNPADFFTKIQKNKSDFLTCRQFLLNLLNKRSSKGERKY